MVYNAQNHWVSGHCPSSGILVTRKYFNVSETGSVCYDRLILILLSICTLLPHVQDIQFHYF